MTENTIHQDFIKAQKEFKPVIFNKVNPFHKNKYADLGSHLNAVMGALNANNISLIQKTHECDNGICVETIIIHSSGEQISGGMLRVPVVKNEPQGYGSALTYARRFSLGALLSLYGEEDNDGNDHIPEKNDNKNPLNKSLLQKKLEKTKQAQAKLKSKEELIIDAEKAALLGTVGFRTWWLTMTDHEEKALLKESLEHFQNKCKEADELNQDVEQ